METRKGWCFGRPELRPEQSRSRLRIELGSLNIVVEASSLTSLEGNRDWTFPLSNRNPVTCSDAFGFPPQFDPITRLPGPRLASLPQPDRWVVDRDGAVKTHCVCNDDRPRSSYRDRLLWICGSPTSTLPTEIRLLVPSILEFSPDLIW